MRDPWDANIETARESENDNLSDTQSDGNRSYSNGTYGQSDYTVRERTDGSGLSDVYVKSDSSSSHSHDVIDKDGNIVASYHDYLAYMSTIIMEYELMNFMKNEEQEDVSKVLTRKLR